MYDIDWDGIFPVVARVLRVKIKQECSERPACAGGTPAVPFENKEGLSRRVFDRQPRLQPTSFVAGLPSTSSGQDRHGAPAGCYDLRGLAMWHRSRLVNL